MSLRGDDEDIRDHAHSLLRRDGLLLVGAVLVSGLSSMGMTKFCPLPAPVVSLVATRHIISIHCPLPSSCLQVECVIRKEATVVQRHTRQLRWHSDSLACPQRAILCQSSIQHSTQVMISELQPTAASTVSLVNSTASIVS